MLEVQVPVLSKHTVTDPDIESISVSGHGYLQTSPEYLMKKLLSSGSPSIYSMGPAFREGEMGRNHRPEFIMIEWYRVGIDELQLIEEIKELLDSVLGSAPYTELAYREVLERAQDKTLEEDLRFSIACDNLKPGGLLFEIILLKRQCLRGWMSMILE